MRRHVLPLMVLLAACGHPAPPPPPPPPVVTEAEAFAKRQACTFTVGALPADTLATDAPKGSQIPVDHIVLVMQENRSFDSYFSALSHGGVRVAPAGASNPDSNGTPVKRFHQSSYCYEDLDHSFEGSHRQFDDGKMDGFVITNEPGGARAIGYYDETDLPYYYALARTFAISDAHFASVMGPTQPNRLYYWAATSFGAVSNGLPPVKDLKGRPTANLFTRLNDAKVPWKVYVSTSASPAVFINLLATQLDRFVPIEDYFTDLDAGTLPPVAVVEAAYGEGGGGPTETDEHPPTNMQVGQQFVARVINSLIASSAWPRSVLFLSYDEHGGFYDSVPPPGTCVPDAYQPDGGQLHAFDQLGFRVPLIAISPYARRGYVSHVVTDHTSVIRFIATRYGMPALTARDANADPLLDLFDFSAPQLTVPTLPTAAVDPVKDAQCHP